MSDAQAINPFSTLQPSSDPPFRPPPRKTYGRARVASPEGDIATFVPAPAANTSNLPEISPRKANLDRWKSEAESWRSGMREWAPESAGDKSSEAEAEQFVANLRRKHASARAPATQAARAVISPAMSSLAPPTREAALRRAHITGSSSLTDISGASEKAIPTSSSALSDPPSSEPAQPSPPRSASKTPQPSKAAIVQTDGSTPLASSPPPAPLSPNRAFTSVPIPPESATTDSDEDETFPIRGAGTARPHARRRHVSISPIDPDIIAADKVRIRMRTQTKSLSPSPRRPTSRPLTTQIRIRSMSPFDAPSPNSGRGGSPASPTAGRTAVSPFQSDGSDEEADEQPQKSKGDLALKQLQQLFADEDASESVEMGQTNSGQSADPIRSDSLDEHAEDDGAVHKKPLKSLPKAEVDQIKRDAERARRERAANFDRPEPKVRPMSTYVMFLNDAGSVLNRNKKPNLVSRNSFTHQSDKTKRKHAVQPIVREQEELHDDIEVFPSSREKGKSQDARKSQDATLVERRSPTPAVTQAAPSPKPLPGVNMSLLDSDDEDDAPVQSAQDLARSVINEKANALEKAKKAEAERLEAEEKKAEKERERAEFATRKAEAARQAARRAKAIPRSEDDSDFDIEVESPVKPKPGLKLPLSKRGNQPDARAVLNRNPDTVPANTKNRQRILNFAGKSAPSHAENATESYIVHAANTFKHDSEHFANGGSKPVGQKAGRDRAIDRDQVNLFLQTRHSDQVLGVREQKEQNFGRSKQLPGKQEMNYEELAARAAQKAAQVAIEDEGEDEDPEDGDYAGSEEESDVEMGSGDEGEVSGGEEQAEVEATDVEEEAEADSESLAVRVSSPAQDDAEEDEENVPVGRRPRHRAKGRVDFASDDEDGFVKPALPAPRVPLAEVGFGDLNFDGFGDESMDGGGFSQLFEETQAKSADLNADASKDVFAGMRPDPMALLNAHAILPKNIISETQAQRDDALVAAEIEEAMEGVPLARTQKKQYLNDAGFFTQTKPSSQYPSQARSNLAGSSTDLSPLPVLDGDHDGTAASPTARSDRIGDSSPTQRSSQRLTRLRRRGSDPTVESYPIDPTQKATPQPSSPTSPPKQTAFDVLMAKRPRSPTPKAARTKTNLVEEQAEESDEDNGWGDAGRGKGEGEEEDGEDEDKFLEGLVDDQAMDPEEKRRGDELAAEKAREDALAADAKEQAQMQRVVDGDHRVKRRTGEFEIDSDSGDDDDDKKRKRWSKRQRKVMDEQKAEGLALLPGERNAARSQYENGEDSDTEKSEEEGEPVQAELRSPEARMTARQQQEMLRKAGEANKRPELQAILDAEAGFYEDDDMNGSASQFTIAKIKRTATIDFNEEDGHSYRPTIRPGDVEHYKAFVSEESQANRRGVGITNASVVMKSMPVGKLSKGDQKYGARRSGGGAGSAGGSGRGGSKLLASKTKSFAS